MRARGTYWFIHGRFRECFKVFWRITRSFISHIVVKDILVCDQNIADCFPTHSMRLHVGFKEGFLKAQPVFPAVGNRTKDLDTFRGVHFIIPKNWRVEFFFTTPSKSGMKHFVITKIKGINRAHCLCGSSYNLDRQKDHHCPDAITFHYHTDMLTELGCSNEYECEEKLKTLPSSIDPLEFTFPSTLLEDRTPLPRWVAIPNNQCPICESPFKSSKNNHMKRHTYFILLGLVDIKTMKTYASWLKGVCFP